MGSGAQSPFPSSRGSPRTLIRFLVVRTAQQRQTTMNFAKKLIGNEEERAVSPVIGVILMVAITVILAAVIAAFVMDMGDDIGGNDAPNAVWESSHQTSVEASDEAIVISFTHNGGDTIDSDELEIGGADSEDVNVKLIADGNIATGDQVHVVTDGAGSTDDVVFEDGDEVHLIWNDGSSSSTTTTHDVTTDLVVE